MLPIAHQAEPAAFQHDDFFKDYSEGPQPRSTTGRSRVLNSVHLPKRTITQSTVLALRPARSIHRVATIHRQSYYFEEPQWRPHPIFPNVFWSPKHRRAMRKHSPSWFAATPARSTDCPSTCLGTAKMLRITSRMC